MIESTTKIPGAPKLVIATPALHARAIAYARGIAQTWPEGPQYHESQREARQNGWLDGYKAAVTDTRRRSSPELELLPELVLRVRQLLKAADNSTCSQTQIDAAREVLDRLELLK